MRIYAPSKEESLDEENKKSLQENSIDEENKKLLQENSIDKEEDTSDSSSGENNLEINKMKFFQRMKAKKERLRANTKDMSFTEKIKYYIYYYKWPAFWSILVLAGIIAVSVTIYKNSRPVAISYAIVNATDTTTINLDGFDEYAEHYGIVKGYQIISSPTMKLSLQDFKNTDVTSDEESSYSQFTLLCGNDYYDIIITDKVGLEYCSVSGLIAPVKDRLFDDTYMALEQKHPDVFVSLLGNNNMYDDYAIDISNTEFVKSLNLGYDKVYVCFPGSSEENIVNVRRFLNYVLELDINI